MTGPKLFIAALAALCIAQAIGGAGSAHSVIAASDPVALVDPFVGTEGGGSKGGNTTPAASEPFGFVSLGPDTTLGDSNSYDATGNVIGFSHTHLSGTGGPGKYGNFRLTPTVGDVAVNNLAFRRSGEVARPGYYAVTLGEGAKAVRAEMTATRLTGRSRFIFAPGQPVGNVILDVTAAVPAQARGQRSTGGRIEVIGPRSMRGWAKFEGGVTGRAYTLYFYAEFDRSALETGIWSSRMGGYDVRPDRRDLSGGDQREHFFNRIGGYARFDLKDSREVGVKVGVSFIDTDTAQRNLVHEQPGWDFASTASAAAGKWRATLSKIRVEGGTDIDRRLFYTALYHTQVMPHDLTGENPNWTTKNAYYDTFFCLWDTFRTVHPLLTLIEPGRQRAMVRSLLDMYLHDGWLPDGRLVHHNDLLQGGTNADVIIADAVVKKLGGFDLPTAYDAVRKDGEVETDAEFSQGRVLKDYLKLGYVSLDQQRSASRTMEYAYDDFAIAQVAAAVGDVAGRDRYLSRSRNWRNLWDPETRCIRPRYADGRWQENFICERRYYDKSMAPWDAPFYEGSARQYSTYVPHDAAALIEKVGGRTAFVAWLDEFFEKWDSPTRGYFFQGNEPDILAPFLYIHAGRPDRTQDVVRTIMAREFRLERTGLPGNDDAGTMSAWYVWNAIGLYPNAGQSFYYIGSPIFRRAEIELEGGRPFVVVAPAASVANRYVGGARLNGRPLRCAFVTHDQVASGGVLELTMVARPTDWGRTAVDPTTLQGICGRST